MRVVRYVVGADFEGRHLLEVTAVGRLGVAMSYVASSSSIVSTEKCCLRKAFGLLSASWELTLGWFGPIILAVLKLRTQRRKRIPPSLESSCGLWDVINCGREKEKWDGEIH